MKASNKSLRAEEKKTALGVLVLGKVKERPVLPGEPEGRRP